MFWIRISSLPRTPADCYFNFRFVQKSNTTYTIPMISDENTLFSFVFVHESGDCAIQMMIWIRINILPRTPANCYSKFRFAQKSNTTYTIPMISNENTSCSIVLVHETGDCVIKMMFWISIDSLPRTPADCYFKLRFAQKSNKTYTIPMISDENTSFSIAFMKESGDYAIQTHVLNQN